MLTICSLLLQNLPSPLRISLCCPVNNIGSGHLAQQPDNTWSLTKVTTSTVYSCVVSDSKASRNVFLNKNHLFPIYVVY